MHSSRPSIPPRTRRFDSGRRTETKPPNHVARREDKNISSISSASPRRATRAPPEPSRLKGIGLSARSSVTQKKTVQQQKTSNPSVSSKSKGGSKVEHVASNLVPANVDPNCNEPSLPCLCCDGHSAQDSNSLFNHNHNNNNTVTIRQQLKLVPPPQENKESEKPEIGKAKCKPEEEEPVASPVSKHMEDKKEEENGNVDEVEEAVNKEDGKIVDENGNGNNQDVNVKNDDDDDDNDDNDDDEEEDDNTLVPSCCDCPASMLDFSLTSSTSSSSTSISSCSDLDSDCPDTFSVSLQEEEGATEHYSDPHPPLSHSTVFPYCSLPLDLSTSVRSPSPCSPDEGYPSAPQSPSSECMEGKASKKENGIKVELLNFLDSIDELGKVDHFYQIVQLAQWELKDDLDLRYRLVHQERLEKVNKQVRFMHLEKLQEAGLDFSDEDISDVLDEMGNIDISWKLYKSDRLSDSQEYSDAGVDMTAPSDLDEPPIPDSLAASPVNPPPRPPKPPARNVSAQPEMHTYMNISGNTPSVSSTSSPAKTFSLSVTQNSSLSPSSVSKPPVLPLPPSQPVPYFALYDDAPTPPIPPPRKRHKARLEAQKLAELERQKTPQSLPAPTSRPPPLPPPPALPSPPAIPPPPILPPPPSFHALDIEIRKLLTLAGITQAELLRLSPELGVCVDGVLEEEQISDALNSKQETGEDVNKEKTFTHRELREGSKLGKEEIYIDEQKEECKDGFRTTSFTEMSKQRKENEGTSNSSCNCGLSDNASFATDSYYSTSISNKQITNSNFGNFDYETVIPDSPPPPPPPRPLPPRPKILPKPPQLPSVKPCALPANSSRPDRFDWLIAFTPDTETPPLEMRKASTKGTSPKSNSVPKVTTFKELRNRSKQASPPTQIQPESELNVITPDPDFLYNLKWRREKADGDGTQWEYTSQAQVNFLQPPPTPASLALFREIRNLNVQADATLELGPMQQISGSANKFNQYKFIEDRKRDLSKTKDEDVVETEVRGMADGGQTWESRTRLSSPPLSLALPSALPSPYYLHSSSLSQAPLFYRSDFYRNQSKALSLQEHSRESLCHMNPTSDSITDYTDSLFFTDSKKHQETLCNHENPSSGIGYANSDSFMDSLYQYSDTKKKKSCYCRMDSVSNIGSLDENRIDSNSNVDSLYCGDKYRIKTMTDTPSTSTYTDGNTTPYKNIEMIQFVNAEKLKKQKSDCVKDTNEVVNSTFSCEENSVPDSVCNTFSDQDILQSKSLSSPFPTLYLYHPKNCPLHKGAPPRLSPVGALSPPHRAGPLSPGATMSHLCSPLFPRSHTLPALAAPLYYPYLYTPRALAPLREPLAPKLQSKQNVSPLSLTVRSLSFAGSAVKAGTWMGDNEKSPLIGGGLPPLCLQEKRALISAVSVAVEAILAQFSSSRTLVQKIHSVDKALSGDSSVNPALGRLVLQCLCPALHSLLCDGLKPHQSDLITGRRPNSPWGLVKASTKPGPNTQALYSLQAKVAALPQLKQSRHRFNAFLLGLLNIKRLDYWLSHLQTCHDVLETYYWPTSFMRLSGTFCQSLFEELLLMLQPLSLLTFNLDLLFQHHHFDPLSPALSPPSAQSSSPDQPQSNGQHLKNVSKQDFTDEKAASHNSSHTSTFKLGPTYCSPISGIGNGETSPQLQWLKEKEIIAPPNIWSGNSFSHQAGQAFQQGWGAVIRWGERLGQNWSGWTSTSVSEEAESHTIVDLNTHSNSNFPKSPSQDLLTAEGGTGSWGLGRLFGASKSPNNPPTNRRPSHWLNPGVTVLSRISSTGQTFLPDKIETGRKGERESSKNDECKETGDQPKPLRVVRTLCDHLGIGAELSFRKGEELLLLGGVDQDWIRCRQGDKEGLVPIGYASLIM
ncbi:uncharacterized protein rusc1 isoform X1 [Tachysurus ichikawai]